MYSETTKSRIAVAKAALKKKRKIPFTIKLGLNLMKKVLNATFVAKLCGAETRTVRKGDQIQVGNL